MRMKPFVLLVAALSALLALACEKPATPNSASATPAQPAGATAAPASSDPVRAAVITYLTDVRGLDMSKMDLSVKNQKIEGDKASCDATFTVKGSPDMPPMEYTYELAKEAGAWKVTASRSKGAAHAGTPASGGDMPPGHPAMGGDANAMSGHGTAPPAMPSGHPPVGTTSGAEPKTK